MPIKTPPSQGPIAFFSPNEGSPGLAVGSADTTSGSKKCATPPKTSTVPKAASSAGTLEAVWHHCPARPRKPEAVSGGPFTSRNEHPEVARPATTQKSMGTNLFTNKSSLDCWKSDGLNSCTVPEQRLTRKARGDPSDLRITRKPLFLTRRPSEARQGSGGGRGCTRSLPKADMIPSVWKTDSAYVPSHPPVSPHPAQVASASRRARPGLAGLGRGLDPGGGTGGVRPGSRGDRRRSGGNANHAVAGHDEDSPAKSTASTGGDRGLAGDIRHLAAGNVRPSGSGRTP